jgi:hypothetical protein
MNKYYFKMKYILFKYPVFVLAASSIYVLSYNIQNPYYKIGLVGLLAQMTTDIIFHPIELINVRTKYHYKLGQSTLQTTKSVYNHSGLTGFIRGSSVTLLGSSTAGFIYFTLYKSIKEYIKKDTDESRYYIAYTIASTVSEFIVFTGYYPFEVIKTRIQSGRFGYKNFFDGVGTIYASSEKGRFVRNMYQGLTSSLLLSISTTFVVFMTFELSRDYLAKKRGVQSSEVRGWDYFFCTLLAGFVSATTLNFLEVYVIHRQVHGNEIRLGEFFNRKNMWNILGSGLGARNLHGIFYTVCLLEFLNFYGDIYNVKL